MSAARRTAIRAVAVLGLWASTIHVAGQTIVYWDTNGTTTGTGTTTTGTWNTSSYWSRSATGTGTTSTWGTVTGTKIATFSAGTNAPGNSTVTVSSAGVTNVGGIVFEEGNVTINGPGSITLSGNATVNATQSSLTGTINAVITDGAATYSLNKTGAGTLALTATNTYTGATAITGGMVEISAFAALGNSGTSAANLVLDGGTLRYASTSTAIANTGRSFTLGVNGGTIDSSGAAAIGFTSNGTALGYSGTGPRTLTLTGANTGNNEMDLVIGDSPTGAATTIVKNGTGTWLFNGSTANRYTGGTIINSGTLLLSSRSGRDATGTGNIVIGDGTNLATLQYVDADNQLNNTANIFLNNRGTLNLNNRSDTFGMLADGTAVSAGYGQVLLGSGSISVGANNLSGTFSGTISGSGSVTASGTGTWTLAGNNTFSGGLTLSAGGLGINSAGALGTGTFQIAAGTTIDNTSGGAVINANNNAMLWTGSFTFGGSSDLNLGTGAVTRYGSNTITTNGSAALTIGGLIDDGTRTYSLTKAGSGTLVLDALNRYSGATIINGGTLIATSLANGGAASSIGTSSNAATNLVLNGGTLKYTGGDVTTNRLFSIGTSGATVEVAGSATLTFSNVGALGFNGQSGARTLTLKGTGDGLLASTLGDNGSASSVVKSGSGTWTLTGTNSFTGGTTVTGGTLALANAAALGSAGMSVNLSGATLHLATDASVNAYNLSVAGSSSILVDKATVASAGITERFGTLQIGAGQTLNIAAGGNVAVNSAYGLTFDAATLGGATTINVANNTNGGGNGTGIVTLGALGQSGSGSLTKTGSGTLVLSAANAGFNGAVNVAAGTLDVQSNSALGSGTAGTTVGNGATLQISGGRLTTSNGNLTIGGTGAAGSGALIGAGGSNRWNGNITLTSDTTISTSGSGYLALGTTSPAYNRSSDPTGTPVDTHTLSLGANTLTISGTTSATDNRAVYVNARITGTGGINIDLANAADTVRYTANMNTYTGTTTIRNGTLSLATLSNTYPGDPSHPGFFGINGPVVIGDGTGAANSARLSTQSGTNYDELMNYATGVTLNQDGRWSLLAKQTVASLTFNGGTIDLGTTGALYLNGLVTVNASAGNTAYIVGSGLSKLDLGINPGPNGNTAPNRTFNVIGGVGNTSDLTIAALIYDGSITKTGAGTMTITGDNSSGYGGTTSVNQGILSVQNSHALGLADATSGTGTIVNAGATLQLSNAANGNLAIANEQLTLNGTGFNNGGALQNAAGNNQWSGVVNVGDASIQANGGTLTLSGTVLINNNLDVRGSGDTAISGAIGGATGSITKTGTGTLYLSGVSTFGGNVTISQGVVQVQSGSALGSGTGVTKVEGSNAALEFAGGISSAESLSLNGTGIAGTGALRSVTGSNTVNGTTTVGTNTLISANSGATLTLGGSVRSTGNNLLSVGTATQSGDVAVNGALLATAGNTLSLDKAGPGTLTLGGGGTVGTLSVNGGQVAVTSAPLTASVVTTSQSSSLVVGPNARLTTDSITTGQNTSLLIASGGTLSVTGSATFSGNIDAASQGTIEISGSGSLTFNAPGLDINAQGLTLVLSGGSIGDNSAALTVNLGGLSSGNQYGSLTIGTLHITGDTVLDFGNSAGTFLSSTNLIIDENVKVTVQNWTTVANAAMNSTIWYLRNLGSPSSATLSGSAGNTTLGNTSIVGGTPLDQISFSNPQGTPGGDTTWVADTSHGWFDHEIRPTPEPGTYGVILISGCLALIGWQRRCRKTDV